MAAAEEALPPWPPLLGLRRETSVHFKTDVLARWRAREGEGTDPFELGFGLGRLGAFRLAGRRPWTSGLALVGLTAWPCVSFSAPMLPWWLLAAWVVTTRTVATQSSSRTTY